MIFALEDWHKAGIRLVHWDAEFGKDVVIALKDGQAFLSELDENYQENLSPIDNLPSFLVDILARRG